MKRHWNKWYLGYGVAVVLLCIILMIDLSEPLKIVCCMGFASSFSISYVSLLHEKMLKHDHDYRIGLNDERNIMIKDRAGNITNMILILLLGIAALIFLWLNLVIPAIAMVVIITVDPIIMIFVSNCLEKQV